VVSVRSIHTAASDPGTEFASAQRSMAMETSLSEMRRLAEDSSKSEQADVRCDFALRWLRSLVRSLGSDEKALSWRFRVEGLGAVLMAKLRYATTGDVRYKRVKAKSRCWVRFVKNREGMYYYDITLG
jgi:hypothetical protein